MTERVKLKWYRVQSQVGSCLESDSVNCSVVSNSAIAWTVAPTRVLCPWNSPGKNTGVGSHSFLQRIFLTQGLHPDLLHCRWNLYRLSSVENTLNCCEGPVLPWVRSRPIWTLGSSFVSWEDQASLSLAGYRLTVSLIESNVHIHLHVITGS